MFNSYVFCHFFTYFINFTITFLLYICLSLDRVLDTIYYAARVCSLCRKTSRAWFNISYKKKSKTYYSSCKAKHLEVEKKRKSECLWNVVVNACHLWFLARSSTKVNPNCNRTAVSCF